jgi:cell division transport system permease protein
MRALRAGLASIRRAPLVQLVTVLTVAVTFLLVGMLRLVGTNLGRAARSFGEGVQATVYLEDGISPVRVKKIADALVHMPGVAAVHTVDNHTAWERLRKSLGERESLLDGVEPELLPTSLEVSFTDGLAGAARLRHELNQLRQAPGVEDLELMGDWVDRLLIAERMLRVGSMLLGALVGIACLHVVAATIRLGVYARREEIEILKLVGATDGFVRGPFLVEGALQGLLGAAIALGLLYGLYRLAAPTIEHSLGAMLAAVPLRYLPPTEIVAALAAGVLIGLVGSRFAVGSHMRGA